MKTVVIDYGVSDSGEGTVTAAAVHISGKFLQIRRNEAEYLVFSPRELTPYHSDLLERFCREKGIRGVYDREKKRYIIEDPSWEVQGGGKFEIDTLNKRVRIYDDSMAYGKFNPTGLKNKVLQIKMLAGYKVTIE